MTQLEINVHFDTLAALLEVQNEGAGFHTSTGHRRHDVEAGEFMLMEANSTYLSFKHRDTRNYVYVENGKLVIPKTDKAFLRGWFEKF